MRFAALLAKVVHYNPEAVKAQTALRMATINGAKALGLDTITGSIEIGKRADLILIHAEMLPTCFLVYDEYSAIVYAMNSKNVRSSMVNGDWIMRNRIVCHVDKENTLEAIEQLSGQIRKM